MDLRQNKKNAIAFYKMAYEGKPKDTLVQNTFNAILMWLMDWMDLSNILTGCRQSTRKNQLNL